MKMTKDLTKEDKKMLNSMILRSFPLNADRMGPAKFHASGFAFAIMPAINRYYKTEEGQTEALIRHTAWYNCCQHIGNFIIGLTASMERENSQNDDFNPQAITAVKASLMGPLSGIGDTFFQGILRVIAASVGISLSMSGSFLGPILFLLIYNIPAIAVRVYATYSSFILGSSFIERIYASGGMKILTKAASTLGLIMMGCMTASNVKFKTILAITISDGDPIEIQGYIDQIFMGLIPLAITLGCFYLLKKNVNVNWIMLGIFVLCLLLGVLGVV